MYTKPIVIKFVILKGKIENSANGIYSQYTQYSIANRKNNGTGSWRFTMLFKKFTAMFGFIFHDFTILNSATLSRFQNLKIITLNL